jgi:hypothetical protein
MQEEFEEGKSEKARSLKKHKSLRLKEVRMKEQRVFIDLTLTRLLVDEPVALITEQGPR